MIGHQPKFFRQGYPFFKYLVIALGTENIFECSSHLVKETKKTRSKAQGYCLLSHKKAATKQNTIKVQIKTFQTVIEKTIIILTKLQQFVETLLLLFGGQAGFFFFSKIIYS